MYRIILPALLMSGVAFNFLKELSLAYLYGAGVTIDTYRIAIFIPFMLHQGMNNVFMAKCSPLLTQGKRRYCSQNIALNALLVALISAATFRLLIGYISPGIDGVEREQLLYYSDVCWVLFVVASGSTYLRSWMIAEDFKRMATVMIATTPFLSLTSLLVGSVIFGVSTRLLYSSYAFSIIGSLLIFTIYYKRKIAPFNHSPIESDSSKILFDIRFQAASLLLITAMAIQSLSRVIDRSFATSWGTSYVSEIDYAYNIFIAIGTILGTSVVINTSRYINQKIKKKDHFLHLLPELLSVLAITITATVVVCSWSREISELLYGRGAITENNVTEISKFLEVIIYALPLSVINMVVLQMLFSHLPSLIVIVIVLAKIITKYLSMHLIQSIDIYASVGYSNLLSEFVFMLTSGILLFLTITAKATKTV